MLARANPAWTNRGEARRAALTLAVIPLLLAFVGGKLIRLQVHGAAASRERIGRTVHEPRRDEAPRGPILDRSGRVLAEDLPRHEVRAEWYATFPASPAGEARHAELVERLVDELSGALLAGEPAMPEQRVELRQRLRERVARATRPDRDAVVRRATAESPAVLRRKIDFLLADDLCSAAAVAALRRLETSADWRSLHLHFRTGFERVYPGGDACLGPVGFIGERDRPEEIRQRLEAVDGLRQGEDGFRVVLRAATKARFWREGEAPPASPGSLFTTLDLDLQTAAQAELEAAVADVTASYGSAPNWGALVLADVASGGVLAMASWVAGSHPRAAAFTPIQSLFEPGSSVKPLVLAMALAHGKIDWEGERVDCTEGAPGGRGWRVVPPGLANPRPRRPIFDDHACGVLTPHEVIVQSSNVGAVKLGLRLGPEGLDDYVETFQLAARTALGLPGELAGARKHDLPSLPETMFWYYTGPSLCFGYETSVTAVQMLRAYLTLLARRPRDLHVIAAVEKDGRRVALPPPPDGAEFLTEEQLDRIKRAMAAVVSDAPGATGRHVAELIARLGFAPGIIAGKTGTSVRTLPDGSRSRTASFAGFAPVQQPRFVAFAVLQKDRAEGFYGGRYAAHAASRLLLRALGVLDTAQGADDADRTRQVRAGDPGRSPLGSAERQVGR